MSNETEFESALTGAAQDDTEQQVLTPYYGRETVERTMTGMMQEMMQGTERSCSRKILGAVDMLKSMGCDNNAIRRQLMDHYGVSQEEADRILPSDE